MSIDHGRVDYKVDHKQTYYNHKKAYLNLMTNNYHIGGDGHKIIGISGISGAGKTTIGEIVAQKLGGVYVDQDRFYKKKKPLIRLSNGKLVKNWDHKDALYLKAMNKDIRSYVENGSLVVIGGFALRDSWFDKDTKPDIHFHIKIPKELSLESRLKVKKFKNVKQAKLEFNEVIYPFYQETLKESIIDHTIEGTDPPESKDRRPVNDIVNEILSRL